MADRKITDLSAQTSLTGTDLMMLVRSGANYKITVANIITSILADHLADTTDAHDASAISVLDTGGNFTATNVETALEEIFNAATVGIELAYVEFTGDVSVTATSEASPTNVVSAGAVAFDGSTRVKIEFFSPRADLGATAGSFLLCNLWDDTSTDLGRICVQALPNMIAPMYGVRFFTPPAATKTYRIRAWRVASDGTISVGTGAGGAGNEEVPGFVRITTA